MDIETLNIISAITRKETTRYLRLCGKITAQEFSFLYSHVIAEIARMVDNPNEVLFPDVVSAIRENMNKMCETNF